jgi:hypothetical protein
VTVAWQAASLLTSIRGRTARLSRNGREMNAAARLARRVAELDHEPGHPATEDAESDLAHFIRVMHQVVPPGQPYAPAGAGTLTAAGADRLQRRCHLLGRLAARHPQLTDGPLDQAAQYWIATGNPPYLPARDYTPRESSFISVSSASGPLLGATPFGAGLFTSTGVLGHPGMWRRYLDGYENSATLHLRPWHIWRLQPRTSVRVYEVRDAARWVELITSYPRTGAGFLHPDWAAVVADWDAVHITLRAVAAAQGFSFATPHGPTIAPYWDTESTFWLAWSFTTATLAGTYPDQDRGPGR